jgi:Siphovirus Gp157
VESGEGIAPELEQQYRVDLAQALQRAIDKRDRVGQFIRYLEDQAAFAAEEAKRGAERKQMFERGAERLRSYVRWALASLGQDEQGKWRKLEGRTTTFSLRKLPDSLQVDDEAAIPSEFKTLVITIPAAAWERHLEACGDPAGILAAIIHTEVKLDRHGLLARLKQGAEVPGADIRLGDYGLAMK